MRERVRRQRRFLTLGAGLLACVVLAACVPPPPPPPPPPPGTFTGLGFDTCAAPTTATMGAWLSSPYRAIGIYIGGENIGCAQRNLTASWVSSVGNSGWHLAPLYVGLQAPCTSATRVSFLSGDPGTAYGQGANDAILAARDSVALGLGPGSPIYLDLEAYDVNDSACAVATMSYVNGWDLTLAQGGYLSGVYSSAASGIVDLATEVSNPGFYLPNAIWIADWNGIASVYGNPYIADNLWADHQRLHQYWSDDSNGSGPESYGGVTIDIDRNAVDAPLAG